jgi:hypothetical protein
MSFLLFGDKKIRSLKFLGNDLYLEDLPQSEEIDFLNSEELRKANAESNISKLLEIHKRSPSSSDPACLLAQSYQMSGKLSEALSVLQSSFPRVNLKSHVAESLGKHYLFFQPDFLLSLYWFLRSAIAQRKKPYSWGTYIYLHAILAALNELWFGAFVSQAKKAKTIADRLYGPGGVGIDYGVIQKLKQMFNNVPDVDISEDLKQSLKCLGF